MNTYQTQKIQITSIIIAAVASSSIRGGTKRRSQRTKIVSENHNSGIIIIDIITFGLNVFSIIVIFLVNNIFTI